MRLAGRKRPNAEEAGRDRAAGVAALALALLVSSGAGAADDKELAQVLRAGGLVIVMRHGATFPIRPIPTRCIRRTLRRSAS